MLPRMVHLSVAGEGGLSGLMSMEISESLDQSLCVEMDALELRIQNCTGRGQNRNSRVNRCLQLC